jgi:hypothetical protein
LGEGGRNEHGLSSRARPTVGGRTANSRRSARAPTPGRLQADWQRPESLRAAACAALLVRPDTRGPASCGLPASASSHRRPGSRAFPDGPDGRTKGTACCPADISTSAGTPPSGRGSNTSMQGSPQARYSRATKACRCATHCAGVGGTGRSTSTSMSPPRASPSTREPNKRISLHERQVIARDRRGPQIPGVCRRTALPW